MPKPKRGITRRLIFYIVLFSSSITLLITTMQLMQEYFDGVDEVKSRLAQIETLSLPALTENLWNLYEKQLQTQLDDLIQVSDLGIVTKQLDEPLSRDHARDA